MDDLAELSVVNWPLSPASRRAILFSRLGIDLVLDVGANVGQYATGLRRGGFAGRVVSFEPIPEVFAELERNAADDPLWDCRNVALGAESHEAEMRVTRDTRASSLLQTAGRLKVASREPVETVATPRVKVETLDGELARMPEDSRTYLKIDVEGYERPVLEGASACLGRVLAVELELSLTTIWSGSHSFLDQVAYMDKQGFRVASVECVTEDVRSGHMLLVDTIFVRLD
jgi:FkbM family methyltransferase